jgi:hypothetical protein
MSGFSARKALITSSFDHLVGAGEQRRWDFKAERLGGLEVDHKVKLEQCCRALYFSAAPIAPAIQ